MYLEHFPTEKRIHGWIEVICGSMFSGKTEELIRRMKRAEFANQKLLLFKPKIDNRYAEDAVISHKGSSLDATVIDKARDCFEYITDEVVVAFDEAQFFDAELVNVSTELAKKGVRVIIAGLDMDFQGKPFGSMPHLLSIAEYVTKVHAICVSCGNLAYVSHRTVKESSQVLVGAVEKYKPLCRSCYNLEIDKKLEEIHE
jgi:thymidine kinase